MRHLNQAGIRTIAAFCLLVVGEVGLQAQSVEGPQDRVVSRLEAIIRTKAQNPVLLKDVYSKTLDVSGDLPSTMAMWLFLEQHRAAIEADNPLLLALQDERTDQQVGGGSTNNGTTSLAVKGGAPAVAGFAFERGGIARENNGSTATFRGNPQGIAQTLGGDNLPEIHRELSRNPMLTAVDKFSFATSFDTSNDDDSTMGTVEPERLSSYAFRYEFINRRNPRDRRYDKAWLNMVVDSAQSLVRKEEELRTLIEDLTEPDRDEAGNPVIPWPELKAWLDNLGSAMESYDARGVSDSVLESFHQEMLSQLQKLSALAREDNPGTKIGAAKKKEFDGNIEAMVAALNQVIIDRENVRALARRGPLVTVEFTNARDPQLPDLYNFLLIGETNIGTRTDLIANAAFSFFRTDPQLPASSSRWRDIHVAGQVEVALPNILRVANLSLSVAGRWEYLPNDTYTPGSLDLLARDSNFASSEQPVTDSQGWLVTPKGNIGIFQTKLVISVRGVGLQIPLSFSVSNRTELIKEKDVQANFGITFNLDTLFSKP